jgi:DNA-directed RNA polymerase subunit F
VLWEINWRKRIKLLTADFNQTIEYLDECSEKELSYATELLEELMEHFKSIELITCVERNIKRCKDAETIKYLNEELEYMKNVQI